MASETTGGFAATVTAAYAVNGPVIDLGRGVHEGVLDRDAVVQAPLAMMNRHGLVGGVGRGDGLGEAARRLRGHTTCR